MDPDHDLRGFGNVCRLFPLPDVVHFPGTVLPLHIFEPRYRQMTEHALATDRLVTMVQVRPDADWGGPGDPAIEGVGCLGRILRCERLPDGRFNFLLLGLKRVRLTQEIAAETLYRQARAEILEDIPPAGSPEPLHDELVALFRAIADEHRPTHQELAKLLGADLSLGVLTDLLAYALAIPPRVKQALLEETRIDRRAGILIDILRKSAPEGPGEPSEESPFPPPFSLN
jgi:uncharacterized protein